MECAHQHVAHNLLPADCWLPGDAWPCMVKAAQTALQAEEHPAMEAPASWKLTK